MKGQHKKTGELLMGIFFGPDFTLSVDYAESGPASNPQLLESGKAPWIIKAQIDIPVRLGKNAAKRRKARAGHNQAQFDFLKTENRLIALTEKVLSDVEDALRKTGLSRNGLVAQAEQSLNAAHQAGETNFLNFWDAQRQVLVFSSRSKTSNEPDFARRDLGNDHRQRNQR